MVLKDCLFSNKGTTNRGYPILYSNSTTTLSLCCSRIGLYTSTSGCFMNACSGPTNTTNYFYTSEFCFNNCVDNSTTQSYSLFTTPASNATYISNNFHVSSDRVSFCFLVFSFYFILFYFILFYFILCVCLCICVESL